MFEHPSYFYLLNICIYRTYFGDLWRHSKDSNCMQTKAIFRLSLNFLRIFLRSFTTSSTAVFFPVPTPWVVNVVEEDSLSRGWDRWMGSAGGLEPTGSRLVLSSKRTHGLTGVVGGVRLRVVGAQPNGDYNLTEDQLGGDQLGGENPLLTKHFWNKN